MISEFFKRKMSVMRFCTEEPTSVSKEDLIEGLKTYCFKDESNIDTVSGFVSFDNPYSDTQEFREHVHVFDNYFVGLFRIDKRRIPASAVKAEVAKGVKYELENSGKEFITRARKQEITEQVKARLLSRAIPATTFVPFVVDMTNGNGYYYSTSAKDFDLFSELLSRAYGSTFITKPLTESEDDFLTYIWWETESNSFLTMSIRDNILVKTWVWNKVSTADEVTKISASGENIEEAKLAISDGADVTKMELLVTIGEEERKFMVNLDGVVSSLEYAAEDLPDNEDEELRPFIDSTHKIFELVDLWKKKYVDASREGKGLNPKIRETWGKGNYCSKAFEDI